MSSSKGVVLVTGANGFVAGRTIEVLLKAGYSVRGTVRAKVEDRARQLREALPEYADKIEVVQLSDFAVPGSCDEAVKGVAAIAHIATPISFEPGTDPAPLIKSAVDGTVELMSAALKTGGVKNFVYMSSVAATLQPKPEEGSGKAWLIDDTCWNTHDIEEAARKGTDTEIFVTYCASKTAAEQAVWRFRDEKKPPFSVTSVNPGYVVGIPLIFPRRPNDGSVTPADFLSDTTKAPWQAYAGEPIDNVAKFEYPFYAYVDMRDVIRAVMLGIEEPDKADGERFLLTGSYVPPNAHLDAVRKVYPDRADIISRGPSDDGEEEAEKKVVPYLPDYKFPPVGVATATGPSFDGSLIVKKTGVDYVPWEKVVKDLIEPLREAGY